MSELKFKPVPYDIVTSASTGKTTVRSTNANAPYNSNLLNRLQAIADQVYVDNLFTKDDINFGSCEVEDLQKLLTQVVIRFDNDPNYYTKRDYQYLIWYLCKSLIYIGSKEIPDNFEQLVDDISDLLERLAKLEKTVDKLQVNRRVFTTKAELEEAVKDRDFTVSGQIFSVTGDEDNNNGSYLVKPGTQEGTLAIIKLSTGAQTTLTLKVPHEDVATLIDNVLTIKDMRTYWDDKSFN